MRTYSLNLVWGSIHPEKLFVFLEMEYDSQWVKKWIMTQLCPNLNFALIFPCPILSTFELSLLCLPHRS